MLTNPPRVVSDWRSAWRWWSVQIPLLISTGAGVWIALPDSQQQAVMDLLGLNHPGWAVVCGGLVAVAGRLVDQAPKEPT